MNKTIELIKVICGFVLGFRFKKREKVPHNYWTEIMKIQPW